MCYLREQTQTGKTVYTIGATAAAKSFSRKWGMKINESTWCGFKKVYITERSAKRLREEDCVNELQPKKKGRSLLLGISLMEYILKLRECGCPVNTHVVITAARGAAQDMDQTRLAEYGGPDTLTTSWVKSFLKRMNSTKRRALTKYSHPADELVKKKEAFISEMLDTVGLNDTPPELIFNWHQTGINTYAC